jgi:hypothetical protein
MQDVRTANSFPHRCSQGLLKSTSRGSNYATLVSAAQESTSFDPLQYFHSLNSKLMYSLRRILDKYWHLILHFQRRIREKDSCQKNIREKGDFIFQYFLIGWSGGWFRQRNAPRFIQLCVCVHPFLILVNLVYFHKNWCKPYAVSKPSGAEGFILMKSVTTTWRSSNCEPQMTLATVALAY